MEILARTPAILVESLLFPYTAGQAFVLPIQTSEGWTAVDALYDGPAPLDGADPPSRQVPSRRGAGRR